jgi:hypothetical protein
MSKYNNTHSKTHVVVDPRRGIVVSKITVDRKTTGGSTKTTTTRNTDSITWDR